MLKYGLWPGWHFNLLNFFGQFSKMQKRRKCLHIWVNTFQHWCCSLPEALLESIWQQSHRPLHVSPSPSRILLSCIVLCSSPRSNGEPFHSLLMLGHTVPEKEKHSCHRVRKAAVKTDNKRACSLIINWLCVFSELHHIWVGCGGVCILPEDSRLVFFTDV